jgi:phosphoribosylamine---glycine ligase
VNVLVVGSGGREHALVDAMRRANRGQQLHAAPGNPGIARFAHCHPVPVADIDAQVDLARSLNADLVVIGPEAPLVAGLADALRRVGIATFGPGANAAALEGSKAFAKDIMRAADVPTANAITASTMVAARAAIAALGGAVVVKADGLAAGKGVVVCDDAATAEAAASQLLVAGSLGDAGRTLVIEERLYGPELSLLAVCDGRTALPLATAQDFKRLADDDHGPNTGGMGAYSPVPGIDTLAATELVDRVHVPVLRELSRRGMHFTGCLYAGLMLTASGPKVLEFNVRFGDPEAQVVLARIDEDLVALLHTAATGRLERHAVRFRKDAAVGVVIASRGYPQSSEAGVEITGVDDAENADPQVRVYHAGTALRGDRLVTAGGRVLCVTALAATLADARCRAYAACDQIHFDGAQQRRDIARAACETPTETSPRGA